MKLNEKIMNLRKKEGLSQEELAEKLNVTRQTVSKWELGTITPKMDKLTEMSKVFNTTVDELINEEDSNVEEPIKQEENPIKNDGLTSNNRKWLIIVIIIALVVLVIYGIHLLFVNFIWNTGKKIVNNPEQAVNMVGGFLDEGMGMMENIKDKYQNKMDQQNGDFEDKVNKAQEEAVDALKTMTGEFNTLSDKSNQEYDTKANETQQQYEAAYQKALEKQKEYMKQAQKEQQKAAEEGLKASQEMLKNLNK